MADNEKLDNQRLKNFKNKGRDLEVKVVPIGVEDLSFTASAALFASSFAAPLPCDVVSNFYRWELCTQSPGQGLYIKLILNIWPGPDDSLSGLTGFVNPWAALAIKRVRNASQSSSASPLLARPTGYMLVQLKTITPQIGLARRVSYRLVEKFIHMAFELLFRTI